VFVCDDARQSNAAFSRAFPAWQMFEFIHVFKIPFHLCGLGESIMLNREPSVVGVDRDCVGEQEALVTPPNPRPCGGLILVRAAAFACRLPGCRV